jgi:hypothetical protein
MEFELLRDAGVLIVAPVAPISAKSPCDALFVLPLQSF